jgi:L,D-transpeptidase ErfK/SrfK
MTARVRRQTCIRDIWADASESGRPESMSLWSVWNGDEDARRNVGDVMHSLIPIVLLLAQLAGSEFSHTVAAGDSLTSIGARYGIDVRVLADANGLRTSERLTPGQPLRLDNRHIVVPADGAEIVINVPQRMLFHFEQEHASGVYPIAAGKADWRTPLGEFEIVTKEENPIWDVPPSIQEEMRRAGKPVLTHVPPSPENPLGNYWIGLSLPGIGIHGTNAPSSIYKLATHGCIRLNPEDVRALFPEVHAGTRGRIVYEPVLLTRVNDSVYLEVHPDPYKIGSEPFGKVLDIARAGSFIEMLDLKRVKDVIHKREGIARDVTRR